MAERVSCLLDIRISQEKVLSICNVFISTALIEANRAIVATFVYLLTRMSLLSRPALTGFLLSAAIVVPLAVVARQFDPTTLRYTDAARWDRATSVSVAYLTDAGIVRGNPDGSFRATAGVNRAEFSSVVASLLGTTPRQSDLRCFPDVNADQWFAVPVCYLKSAGIVSGNAVAGWSADRWPFEPARGVRYAEALKMLSVAYQLPPMSQPGDTWYAPYLRYARDHDLALAGVQPEDFLSRAGMARLVAAYRADSLGELDDLRAAERGETLSSSSSSRSSRSSSSRMSSKSSSKPNSSTSSRSSVSSGSSRSMRADLLTDRTVRSNFIVMGETSPILAAVEFFSQYEPVDATKIIVTLSQPSQTVASMLVYDSEGALLGQATKLGSGETYTLNLTAGALTLPYRKEVGVYVRAVANAYNGGGVSGEDISVASVRVEGNGGWSNETYGQTSNENFEPFEAARGVITKIENAGTAESILTNGVDRVIGEFRFTGRATDSLSDVRVTGLTFRVESVGVTLSNAKLRVEGLDTPVSCTASSVAVTCSGLDATYGSLRAGPKLMRIYADVDVATNVSNPYLRLTLNEPGSRALPGDISWTDGQTGFAWVAMDMPVVRGTLWR